MQRQDRQHSDDEQAQSAVHYKPRGTAPFLFIQHEGNQSSTAEGARRKEERGSREWQQDPSDTPWHARGLGSVLQPEISRRNSPPITHKKGRENCAREERRKRKAGIVRPDLMYGSPSARETTSFRPEYISPTFMRSNPSNFIHSDPRERDKQIKTSREATCRPWPP